MSGLNSIIARLTPGAIPVSNSNHLLAMDPSSELNPVMFPPGRGRLATNPEPTGSATTAKTIGIVVVSRFTAAVTGVESVKIRSGCRLTRSFANVRIRSVFAGAQRTSILRFWRSIQPNSESACVNSPSRALASESVSAYPMSTPIRAKRSVFCACAGSGQAAAVPPSRVMKSRRLSAASMTG